MHYLFIGFFLVAVALGGPLMGALCGAGGIIYIFYICFKTGPKLTLFAIPVVICFVIVSAFENFFWMFFKHVLKYIVICMIGTIVFCRHYYEEDYKHIVIAVTAGFTVVTMTLLAMWMYVPREFPVSDRTVKIEIQNMDESLQAVYTDPADFEELMESLDRTKMCGTFEELVSTHPMYDTYRLSFYNKKDKEIETYYFLDKYYIAKASGKNYIFYSYADGYQFPYDEVADMYESVVGQ